MSKPIFIIGVPRSGTTLLRVLLDSHPNIACGPETPWLARAQCSIKKVYQFMSDDQFGYVKNFGISNDIFRRQIGKWIHALFMDYAFSRGKQRWAEKTPDHSLEIPFLSDMFPDAFFIHLVRDGRDVACSTAILSDKHKSISSWHSKYLLMDENQVVDNTIENAALRWQRWLHKITTGLQNLNSICIEYENLVSKPREVLQTIMLFIEEEYDEAMLNFARYQHDFPRWEWGSHDVRNSQLISSDSIGRWKRHLSPEMINKIEDMIGDTLNQYGYLLSRKERSS